MTVEGHRKSGTPGWGDPDAAALTRTGRESWGRGSKRGASPSGGYTPIPRTTAPINPAMKRQTVKPAAAISFALMRVY